MERVSDYIIRKINEAGASHIYLITGRGILYLTDAVAKNQNIVSVSTFHEQGASYAAMAYAAAKNSISACLVSTGCAATNATTACLCAYQDNLPVVFISGNNPLNENTRHTGCPIRTYGSQEADIVDIVDSITKYAVMFENVDTVVYEVEKALWLAQNGRKGPVWIDIPLDIQNMRIEESAQKHYFPVVDTNENLIVEAKIVADELNSAKRPIILIGGGSRAAEEEIRTLVEKIEIPIVFSPTASDVYGSWNRLSVGAVGSLGGTRAGNFSIQNSDYVLAIGTKLCSQLTGMKDKFAREAKITVVDIDEIEHKKDGVKIDHLIIGSSKEFVSKLLSYDLKPCNHSWKDRCLHWKKLFSINNEEFIQELISSNQIDLYSLVDLINSVLPDEATVMTDAGFEELIVPSTLKLRSGQKCLFPAGQGAMGYAIPAILGAYDSGMKNLIAIVGDGSFMMNIQELLVIASRKIPVKILVINNNMYSVIRKRQHDLFRTRTIGNDSSDGVPTPDFEMLASCFGFCYRKINDRRNLINNISTILSSMDVPEIIEIMCTPDQQYFHESYALNMNRRLVHRPIEDLSPFLPRDLIKKEMIIKQCE